MNPKNIDINTAIEQFYRMKNKYETLRYEKYVKPILTSKMSRKEKRREPTKIAPECIFCKENVGTIFTIKNNKAPELFMETKVTENAPTEIPIDVTPVATAETLVETPQNIAEPKPLEEANPNVQEKSVLDNVVDSVSNLLSGGAGPSNNPSIFNQVNDVFRTFTIECGNTANPCTHITFTYGNRMRYDKMIAVLETEISDLKRQVVITKNDVLFGYISPEQATSKFSELTEKLKKISEHTGYIIEKNILVNDNPIKQDLLNKKLVEFGEIYLATFKKLIRDFEQTNDQNIVHNAMEYFLDTMKPQLQEIQELRYENMMIDKDDNTNVVTLLQRKNNLENLEFFTEGNDKVIEYKVGIRKQANASRAAPVMGSEEMEIEIQPKKARKTKAIVELEIEEDENVNEEAVDEEETGKTITGDESDNESYTTINEAETGNESDNE